jgi:hypothetical protein
MDIRLQFRRISYHFLCLKLYPTARELLVWSSKMTNLILHCSVSDQSLSVLRGKLFRP